MGPFRATDRPLRKPQKRSRQSLLLFLLLVYVGTRFLGTPSPHFLHHPKRLAKPPLPVIYPADFNSEWAPSPIYHLTGGRVRGNGTYLDLGDRRTQLPASLISRFFPAELVVPSCLTQPAPAMPAPNQTTQKPLPVREDWPGFYGAPWITHSNGNLIALLHVYAPRHRNLPVAPPEFQIYPEYNGQQTSPAFDLTAPASFQRGSKAVLYRVFLNGPVRCLDLVVQNGENNGIGHLYYQKYHHYYEVVTTFQIQP